MSDHSYFDWSKEELVQMDKEFVKQMRSHELNQNETFAFLYEDITSKLVLPSIYAITNLHSYIIFTNISQNFVILEEAYFTKTIPLYVAHQNYIFEPLQDFILRYREYGLELNLKPSYHTKKLTYDLEQLISLRRESNPSEPKILTLNMLQAGFAIWFALIPVACVIFLGEHILDYYSSLKMQEPEESSLVRNTMSDGQHIPVTHLCLIEIS